MPDSTNPATNSDTAPITPAAKKKRDAQNKKITNYASEAGVFLATLADDPELKAIAVSHGYPDEQLAIGTGLVNALGGGLQQRQKAIGDRKKQQEALDLGISTAREDYAAFREIARASFPLQADRLSLGLTGDVPEDLERFITAATTSYTNAGQEPYVAKMTQRNYAPARLGTLIENLDGLTDDESERNTASGDAVEDTESRDQAYDNLRAWMKELKGVLRGALRGQHGQLVKLKL